MIIAEHKNFQKWLEDIANTISKLLNELQRVETIAFPKQTFVSLLYYEIESYHENKLFIASKFYHFFLCVSMTDIAPNGSQDVHVDTRK